MDICTHSSVSPSDADKKIRISRLDKGRFRINGLGWGRRFLGGLVFHPSTGWSSILFTHLQGGGLVFLPTRGGLVFTRLVFLKSVYNTSFLCFKGGPGTILGPSRGAGIFLDSSRGGGRVLFLTP